MISPPAEAPADRGRRAPSPPATPWLGHARLFQRDPLGFLRRTAEACGPVARLKVGPLTYHLVSEPALIAQVLQERAANYLRDTRSSRSIRLVAGESLLTTEGQAWRRHRQLAAPIFHHRRLAALAGSMAQATQETAQRWEQAAQQGETLDLASELNHLAFTVVGRCLFGTELGAESGRMEAAFPVLLAELFSRAQQAVSFPLWMPTARHRTFRRALGVVDGIVDQIVALRRRQPGRGDDLLGVLLDARAEDGSKLEDAEVRDQVVTFLLAGHETTASALTWAFALLAQHPAEQQAVEQEIDRAGIGDGTPADLEKLPALTRINAVLQETLRLYPSIWIAERRVVAADNLGGYAIPAGSSVIIAPYVTHRLPALWAEPDAFQPARFLGEPTPTLLAGGYFPFGAGPHSCIGQHFALMEAKVILALLSARFRLQLVQAVFPLPLAGITLRPASAVPVRIEKRPPRERS